MAQACAKCGKASGDAVTCQACGKTVCLECCVTEMMLGGIAALSRGASPKESLPCPLCKAIAFFGARPAPPRGAASPRPTAAIPEDAPTPAGLYVLALIGAIVVILVVAGAIVFLLG